MFSIVAFSCFLRLLSGWLTGEPVTLWLLPSGVAFAWFAVDQARRNRTERDNKV
jgi:hypothetical protein